MLLEISCSQRVKLAQHLSTVVSAVFPITVHIDQKEGSSLAKIIQQTFPNVSSQGLCVFFNIPRQAPSSSTINILNIHRAIQKPVQVYVFR